MRMGWLALSSMLDLRGMGSLPQPVVSHHWGNYESKIRHRHRRGDRRDQPPPPTWPDSGLHVTVVEKNSRPGGRCDRFSRDGHRFDTGPTLFVMPLLYEAEFRALGTSMHERLDLLRVDPTYHLVFDDGSQLALTSDMKSMQEQLEVDRAGQLPGLAALPAGRRAALPAGPGQTGQPRFPQGLRFPQPPKSGLDLPAQAVRQSLPQHVRLISTIRA